MDGLLLTFAREVIGRRKFNARMKALSFERTSLMAPCFSILDAYVPRDPNAATT